MKMRTDWNFQKEPYVRCLLKSFNDFIKAEQTPTKTDSTIGSLFLEIER